MPTSQARRVTDERFPNSVVTIEGYFKTAHLRLSDVRRGRRLRGRRRLQRGGTGSG